MIVFSPKFKAVAVRDIHRNKYFFIIVSDKKAELIVFKFCKGIFERKDIDLAACIARKSVVYENRYTSFYKLSMLFRCFETCGFTGFYVTDYLISENV